MIRLVVMNVTALAAVLGAALVHGVWTGRWELSAEPAATAARLPSVPLDVGDWHGEDLPADAVHLGGASAALYRRYVNRTTGASATVFLLCGRPGPVALHPPDVCYGASGYDVLAPTTFAQDGSEFKVARMRKRRQAEQTQLRVWWAWNDGAGWRVPDDPRTAYAPGKVLLKLYFVRELADESSPQEDPAADLMRALLPALGQTLFTGSGARATATMDNGEVSPLHWR